jgi:hydrogenase maturation protease
LNTTNPKTIICCLGNPIGGDDGIGCMIGRRLKRSLPKRDFKVIPEYSGSALDLVLELCGFDRVVVIDAVITGKMPPGTVRLFTEKEICGKMKPNSFHGVNLPQALVMGRKLKLKLPRSIKLIGIEIKPVSSFGDKLSPALNKRLAAICAEVERILLAKNSFIRNARRRRK